MVQVYSYTQTLLEDVKAYLSTARKGQGMVEYSLILVAIALAVMLVLPGVGGAIAGTFSDIAAQLGG